jgi:uncharacterized membrane protein YhaH (DUF805 family)
MYEVSDVWHYADKGTSSGPHTAQEMDRLIAKGAIWAQTLVWNDSMTSWEPAARHFEMTERSQINFNSGPQLGRDKLYVGAPARGFFEALYTCIRKYFVVSGRASRSEYWYFVLWQVLVSLALGFYDGMSARGGQPTEPIGSYAMYFFLLPTITVTIRRFHDINWSGWWIVALYVLFFGTVALVWPLISDPVALMNMTRGQLERLLLMIAPSLVASLVLLFMLCIRGNLEPNRYG